MEKNKPGRPPLEDSPIVNVTDICRKIVHETPRDERRKTIELVIPAFAQFSEKVFNSMIFLLGKRAYICVRDKRTNSITEKVMDVPFVVYDVFTAFKGGYKHNNIQIGENLYLTYYWRYTEEV